ncbi:PQQ-binding-like beta-propeller repeat protein, partial [Candidatus Poribacteria bacterium]|nr:PQQ-binding-like beta-propeller repeat protein [Candidatus Poribacteria bacterium]
FDLENYKKKSEYVVRGNVLGIPTVGEVLDDNRESLDVATACDNGRIYTFDGSKAWPEWKPYQAMGRISASPVLIDANNDGFLDIAVGSSEKRFYMINGKTGTGMWVKDKIGGVNLTAAVGYLDHDKKPDVVVADDTGFVYSLKAADKSQIWTFDAGGKIVSSPLILDTDNDGHDEVIIFNAQGKVFALKGEKGDVLWNKKIAENIINAPVCAGDINDDALAEILTIATEEENYYLFAINARDGSIVWQQDINDKSRNPLLVDMDGTGSVDVLISGGSYIYSMDGKTGEYTCRYYVGKGDYTCIGIFNIGYELNFVLANAKEESVYVMKSGHKTRKSRVLWAKGYGDCYHTNNLGSSLRYAQNPFNFTINADITIPSIFVNHPSEEAKIDADKTTLKGYVTDNREIASIKINGENYISDSKSLQKKEFEKTLPLVYGENTINVEAVDKSSNKAEKQQKVTRLKPELNIKYTGIKEPERGQDAAITMEIENKGEGTARDVEVSINAIKEKLGAVKPGEKITYEKNMRIPQTDSIIIFAVDADGNKSNELRIETREKPDTQKPNILVLEPKDDIPTESEFVNLRCRITDDKKVVNVDIIVNDEDYTSKAKITDRYTASVGIEGKITLKPGANMIVVSASDAAGNSDEETIQITRLIPKPIDNQLPKIVINSPENEYRTDKEYIRIIGYAEDIQGINSIKINNQEILSKSIEVRGRNRIHINKEIKLEFGKNEISILAEDVNELISEKILIIYSSSLGEDIPQKDKKKITKSKRKALVIGINDYEDDNITDLKYAVNDARKMYKILKEKGNFEDIEIITSDRENPDEKPADLDTIFVSIQKLVNTADKDETILLYFSGHGMMVKESLGILPVDVNSETLPKRVVNIEEDFFGNSDIEGPNKIAILDTCWKRSKALSVEDEDFSNIFKGKLALFSCSPGQESFEDDEEKLGVFTSYLVEGLNGKADINKNGRITFSEISNYVGLKARSVPEYFKQTPTRRADGSGDFTLVWTSKERRIEDIEGLIELEKERIIRILNTKDENKSKGLSKVEKDSLVWIKKLIKGGIDARTYLCEINEKRKDRAFDLYQEEDISPEQLTSIEEILDDEYSGKHLTENEKMYLKAVIDFLDAEFSVSFYIKAYEDFNVIK